MCFNQQISNPPSRCLFLHYIKLIDILPSNKIQVTQMTHDYNRSGRLRSEILSLKLMLIKKMEYEKSAEHGIYLKFKLCLAICL